MPSISAHSVIDQYIKDHVRKDLTGLTTDNHEFGELVGLRDETPKHAQVWIGPGPAEGTLVCCAKDGSSYALSLARQTDTTYTGRPKWLRTSEAFHGSEPALLRTKIDEAVIKVTERSLADTKWHPLRPSHMESLQAMARSPRSLSAKLWEKVQEWIPRGIEPETARSMLLAYMERRAPRSNNQQALQELTEDIQSGFGIYSCCAASPEPVVWSITRSDTDCAVRTSCLVRKSAEELSWHTKTMRIEPQPQTTQSPIVAISKAITKLATDMLHDLTSLSTAATAVSQRPLYSHVAASPADLSWTLSNILIGSGFTEKDLDHIPESGTEPKLDFASDSA